MAQTIGAAPETGFLGLQIDLLTKIRKEQITFQHLHSFLKLSKADRDKLFGKKLDNLVLRQKDIVIPALTETFDPQREFTQDETVKYFLGYDFKRYLCNTTQPFTNIAEVIVDKSVLKRVTNDVDIMAEIDVKERYGLLSKEEILWRIHYLTHQQPNCEPGVLNNSSDYVTIIGYFVCEDCVTRVAIVRCLANRLEWACDVYGLVRWGDGSVVLSRNGVLSA